MTGQSSTIISHTVAELLGAGVGGKEEPCASLEEVDDGVKLEAPPAGGDADSDSEVDVVDTIEDEGDTEALLIDAI